MPSQHEYIPSEYVRLDHNDQASPELILRSTDREETPFVLTFRPVSAGVFRTTFTDRKHPTPPYPSALCPAANWGNEQVAYANTEKTHTVTVGKAKAVVNWEGVPTVSLYLNGHSDPIHADLPYRSYVVDHAGIAHYTRYKRETLHVGLGEKAAPMNLSNRSFKIATTDCFGYDAYHTDPMYKHIPLLINATPNGVVAMFSTSHSRGVWDIGAEIDGHWGSFKVYRQAYGGLEEYLIVGDTLQEVISKYARLVGHPRLVPRWAFGYISGGMKYSMLDEPRAQDALMDFANKLKKFDIPCSAFQLSSGYTVAETEPKTRNVFTWNKHRFPNPQGFVTDYRSRGIRIIANVKPYVLENHPEYATLKERNAFVEDPAEKGPHKAGRTRLWSCAGGASAKGGHLDFTSKAGFDWWVQGIKSLRKIGIEGIWNDNNDYTIPADSWEYALEDFTKKRGLHGKKVGLWGRAMQTELVGRASHEAVTDLFPKERPYVLTRSATAGTMRYCASSWGGDNYTRWDDMKGGNSLTLNAGMSLLQCYGHDIGGFEGPQPSPELLVRWIQLGIHGSRFAINCFKTDENDNTIGGVIEPWMYDETTALIRDAIKRRYELIPYLYSLMLESHLTAKPPQRWIGWGFEKDPEVWTKRGMAGETQYWLGDALMVGGVYEAGEDVAKLYLPTSGDDDEGYINLSAPHQYLSAGWAKIRSEWKDSIPLLARIGGAIPVGKSIQTRAPGDVRNIADLPDDDYRGIEIFPPQGSSKGKTYSTTWYEDDGIAADPKISKFTIQYHSTETHVTVSLHPHPANEYVPVWTNVSIILPVGDKRVVIPHHGAETQNNLEYLQVSDSRRRAVWKGRNKHE
ncbi:neutral alpha-glucosidase ab [Coleophoma cylindrospora]|uniref:alpha-glucosidase n=1 Tax=Coleophoma cylindrospora TaxID=1849047 RepID=A0A3D8SNV3_9HELO|nr:neutral alpha-glucosidase ab [Coleophoma cylindrospora]